MKTFTVTYRKRYWLEEYTTEILAYNFADAEDKFNNEFQEEDNLIITEISTNNPIPKKELIETLDLAQCELRVLYKRAGYLNSNILVKIDTMHEYVKSSNK